MIDPNIKIIDDMAVIISRGREEDWGNIEIAYEIFLYLKKQAKSEVKPKRGIGSISQIDLFRVK